MKIAVIGAGAWGTALSMVLSRKSTHEVRLWAFEKEVCDSINNNHENQAFLKGYSIPEAVVASHRLEVVVPDAQVVVTVMPSHHCRAMVHEIAPYVSPETLFVSATKGIENQTFLRMTQVIKQVLGTSRGFEPRVGALTGPSFAKEVARGDPTAVTMASEDAGLAAAIQKEFSEPNFRIYTGDDVIGVEMGGSIKNVIAIAAGICDGLGLGHNTIAALITRGLAEITRLSVACGGQAKTMAGLAGMGDLVLTCTGGLSRNRTVGVELGRGKQLPEIIEGMHGMVAEGVLTTTATLGLAQKMGVEMPITEQMSMILNGTKSPVEAIGELMTRPGKVE